MEELCYKIFNNFLQVKNAFLKIIFKIKKTKVSGNFRLFYLIDSKSGYGLSNSNS
jgi:hypothetical protein